MRKTLPEKLEAGRKKGDPRWGAYGMFEVMGPNGRLLRIIGSRGDDDDPPADGWEHVSVSIGDVARPPNWREMCFVKDLFWSEDEVVVQFHPAKSQYVNFHPGCLHLWRHRSAAFPMPPVILVGPK
jgi:hypothetical protein